MVQASAPDVSVLIALSGLMVPPDEVIRLKQTENQSPWYQRLLGLLGAKEGIITPVNTAEMLRDFYWRGLISVEETLVGKDSDWQKAITDLRLRQKKLQQQLNELEKRIQSAQQEGADHRHFVLTSAKDRIKSQERGHQEAWQLLRHLIESTKAEIDELYVCIDGLYQGVEPDELVRTQMHKKVIHRLSEIITIVHENIFLADAKRENIDLPIYLDKIEGTTVLITKNSEC